MSGPDPHVVRPKAHARCEAPQTLLIYLPLTNPTFSRFYYFWFILVIDYFSRTLKKTKIHTLLTYCSQILQMTYSFHLLSSPPSFSFPSSPFLVFILFFSPFSFFSFSFLLVFLPFLFFLFPPLKTSEGQWGRPEARGPLKREAKARAFGAFKGIRYWCMWLKSLQSCLHSDQTKKYKYNANSIIFISWSKNDTVWVLFKRKYT